MEHYTRARRAPGLIEDAKEVLLKLFDADAEYSADTLEGIYDELEKVSKQVLAGDVAVLEFETSLDGKHVNGVDIIRCDSAGRIVEFRVMIRPLQAINAVHEAMRAMLASLQP